MASVYWQVLLMLRIESSCSAGWGVYLCSLIFAMSFLAWFFSCVSLYAWLYELELVILLF